MKDSTLLDLSKILFVLIMGAYVYQNVGLVLGAWG